MTRLDALVLDLDTRGGLAIVRALGRSGLRVGVAARDADASGMRTRYAATRTALPAPEDDFDAYADAIVALANEHPADAILVCIDSSVVALHRRRESLASVAPPALGSERAVEMALSKPRTIEVAEALDVPTPRSVAARTEAEVSTAARELGLPVVVKPDESWRDRDAGGERLAPVLVANEGDLASAARLAPALVQEVAPGRRETIKLFRDDGQVIARFAMAVERTWPPLGGSSVMRTSIAPPADVLAHAEALVDAIGLDGYSEVEFRRSRQGRPLLMEVNPRLSQSVELAVRSGIDFPRLQLEWTRGGRLPRTNGYRVGVRLGWLAGDARLAGAALTGRGPKPRPGVPPLVQDYAAGRARLEGLDRDDLGPVLGAVAFAARGSLRRLGTRSRAASRR